MLLNFNHSNTLSKHSLRVWCGSNECFSNGNQVMCNITSVFNPYSDHTTYVLPGRNYTNSNLVGTQFLDTFLIMGQTYENVIYNNSEKIYSLYCDKLHRVIINHDTSITNEVLYTPGRILSFLLTSSMFIFIMMTLAKFIGAIGPKINKKAIIFFTAIVSLVLVAQLIMTLSDIFAMTWLDVCYGSLVGVLICLYILEFDNIHESLRMTHPSSVSDFDIEDEDAQSDYDDQIPKANDVNTKQKTDEIEMRERIKINKKERRDSDDMSEVSL